MPSDKHRIADLMSYGTDSPHGLEFKACDVDAGTYVELQLTPTDIAFLVCAVIDKYGLDNTRRAIDDIATQDPTGQRVGLSSVARILQGGRN